jgi:sugar-specific transcriptional regulator TrmB
MTSQKDNSKLPTTKKGESATIQCAPAFEVSPELLKAVQGRFNLTESQSRVYIALLIMRQLTPDEVSRYSGVTFAKVQTALETLQEKGFIKPLPGVVTRYEAYAPYKELSDEVKAFTKETQDSWNELQKLQNKTMDEIREELQSMIRQTKTAIDNLNEQQGIALNEAAMSTNIVLNNVAENLQKSLTNLSTSSTDEFSKQITTLHQSVKKSIADSVSQIDEAENLALTDVKKGLEAHKEETEQWLTTIADRLLNQSDALTQQLKTHLDDANSLQQRNIDSSVKTITTEITSEKEGISEIAEETATTINTNLKSFTRETQQDISTLQEAINQILSKQHQDVKSQIHETWTQRTQSLDEMLSRIEKLLQKETRRLQQTSDKFASDMDAIIKAARENSIQTTETLFQDLQNSLETSNQGYKRLQKEVESTISQWPPTALSFSQFSKIQSDLNTLTEQVKTDHERLLEVASEELGVEMRDTYLAQLLEVNTLSQSLIKDIKKQKTTLTGNFESIANQVATRLKRRLATIRKTGTAFLTDFQAKIALQEEQTRTFNKRTSNLLKQQTNVVLNSLKTTEDQIAQYVEERINRAKNNVRQAARENITKATKRQKDIEKQLESFQAALKKMTKETTSELRQEFTHLEKTIKQYSDGIESTADKLREEQTLQIDKATTGYQQSMTKIKKKRNRAINRALRSHSTQLRKRDQKIITGLATLLIEVIPEYALLALNKYQNTVEEHQEPLKTQAISTAQSTIDEQITDEQLAIFNTSLTEVLKTHLNTIRTTIQDLIKTQYTQFKKESNDALSPVREALTELQNQVIIQIKDHLEKELKTQVNAIFRDYKAKLTRQINRETQINKIFQQTSAQIIKLPTTLLERESKSVRTKLEEELQTILSDLRKQLKKQILRDKQIAALLKSTQDNLKQLPQELLAEIPEQNLSSQVENLESSLIDYQSLLEEKMKDYGESINTETQSLHKKLLQVNYAKSVKTDFSKILKGTIKSAIKSHLDTFEVSDEELKNQAQNAFVASIENRLQKQVLTELQEYLNTEAPEIKLFLDKFKTKLNEKIDKYDTETKTLVDKHWLPLTQIIDEYVSTVVSNLNALNTVSGTAVDQATVNVTTNLTKYSDDANNLLIATAQAFDREKTGFNEQITQGINEMQEDCLAQLQETQTRLEALGKDISAQKTASSQKSEAMTGEIESLTLTNLEAIHETADSFVENVQKDLEEQDKRIENLSKSINDLILQQSTNIIDILANIQTKLEEFAQNQIPQAQNIIEEIGQSCAEKIDEQRAEIDKHLDTYAKALSEEIENYITNLKEELVQLQTVASKLVEKIKLTGTTIDTELKQTIEKNRVQKLTAIDEQQNSLNKEITSTFQALEEDLNTTQTQLLSTLTQEAKEGKEAVDQSSTQIDTTLDKALDQTESKSTEITQGLQTSLASKTDTFATQIQTNLSSISNKVNTTSEQLIQTLTSLLTESQTELNRILSETSQTIEEDNLKIRTGFGQEIEQTLQSFTQTPDLTYTILNRAIQDGIRRIREIMRTFEESTLTDVQQRKETLIATIKQIIDAAEDSLVTQTQQTGRRISQTLSKERQTLKTEYRTLAKEITTRTKTAENTSINTLQLFSKKTEPILDRLRNQATSTEQILTGLWEALSSLEPSEAERTWRIVSCEGIQNHLLDMSRRVNNTITLVYPSFDEIPVVELSKVQPHTRIHIITTLDGEKQRTAVQKLLQQGNIRIWNNPNMEFYGGSRDGEEVLIAPTYGNQAETVAVVSDQPSYIALFNQTLGPRWISASEEILLRK